MESAIVYACALAGRAIDHVQFPSFGHVRLAGSWWMRQQCWSTSRSSGPQIRYLTICPLDLGSFWIDFKTCFLADREPNFSLLVCHHVLTSLFARAFVRPERRNDDLAGPAAIGDTSPSRRCASPSALLRLGLHRDIDEVLSPMRYDPADLCCNNPHAD